MPKTRIVKDKRTMTCFYCLMPLHKWRGLVEHADGTPYKKCRQAREPQTYSGSGVDICNVVPEKVEWLVDPRERRHWILHPAADGNKPWREPKAYAIVRSEKETY